MSESFFVVSLFRKTIISWNCVNYISELLTFWPGFWFFLKRDLAFSSRTICISGFVCLALYIQYNTKKATGCFQLVTFLLTFAHHPVTGAFTILGDFGVTVEATPPDNNISHFVFSLHLVNSL